MAGAVPGRDLNLPPVDAGHFSELADVVVKAAPSAPGPSAR